MIADDDDDEFEVSEARGTGPGMDEVKDLAPYSNFWFNNRLCVYCVGVILPLHYPKYLHKNKWSANGLLLKTGLNMVCTGRFY